MFEFNRRPELIKVGGFKNVYNIRIHAKRVNYGIVQNYFKCI